MVRTDPGALNLRFSIGDISILLTRLYTGTIFENESSLRPFIVHSHNYTEIQYILSGQGQLVSDSGTTRFQPGSLIVVPPGIKHRLEADSTLNRMTVCMQIFPPNTRDLSDTWGFYSALHPASPIVLDPIQGSELENCLLTLKSLIQSHPPDIYAAEQLRARCMLFLLALRPLLPTLPEQDMLPSPLSVSTQAVTIDDFFQQHHFVSPPASMLAQQLHISSRQLNRILKNLYGMSYRDKLNASRLKCAVEQLTGTDMPIAYISHLLGYSSTTAFGSFIRAQTGMTPSQIRENSRHSPQREQAL